MLVNRCFLQLFMFVFGILAVYATIEPLTDSDELYMLPEFYNTNEIAYGDSRAKRFASSLRFGKRAKGWASAVRFG